MTDQPHTAVPHQTARVRSRSTAITLAWGAATDSGRVRQVNEDSLCVSPPVFAVADGMGGHQGGDVASAIAVGSLSTFEAGQALDEAVLRSAVTSTNRLIFQRSGSGERVMGTTVSGIAVASGPSPAMFVFNVGDSRTYLLEHAQFQQITRDHSQVWELYESGAISFEDMATRPDRNVVTRALGVDPEVELDVLTVPARVGQRWLVCSDGLSGEISERQISECLAIANPQVAADALVAATLSGPARDNVSVVVIDVVEAELLDDPDRTDPRRLPATSRADDTSASVDDTAEVVLIIDSVPFTSTPGLGSPTPDSELRELIDEVPGSVNAGGEPSSENSIKIQLGDDLDV